MNKLCYSSDREKETGILVHRASRVRSNQRLFLTYGVCRRTTIAH